MIAFMFSALIVIAFVVVLAKIAAVALRPMLIIGALALVAGGLRAIGIDPAVAVVVLLVALLAWLLIGWVRREVAPAPEPLTLASSAGLTAPVRCPVCGGTYRDGCARCGGAGWVEA